MKPLPRLLPLSLLLIGLRASTVFGASVLQVDQGYIHLEAKDYSSAAASFLAAANAHPNDAEARLLGAFSRLVIFYESESVQDFLKDAGYASPVLEVGEKASLDDWGELSSAFPTDTLKAFLLDEGVAVLEQVDADLAAFEALATSVLIREGWLSDAPVRVGAADARLVRSAIRAIIGLHFLLDGYNTSATVAEIERADELFGETLALPVLGLKPNFLKGNANQAARDRFRTEYTLAETHFRNAHLTIKARPATTDFLFYLETEEDVDNANSFASYFEDLVACFVGPGLDDSVGPDSSVDLRPLVNGTADLRQLQAPISSVFWDEAAGYSIIDPTFGGIFQDPEVESVEALRNSIIGLTDYMESEAVVENVLPGTRLIGEDSSPWYDGDSYALFALWVEMAQTAGTPTPHAVVSRHPQLGFFTLLSNAPFLNEDAAFAEDFLFRNDWLRYQEPGPLDPLRPYSWPLVYLNSVDRWVVVQGTARDLLIYDVSRGAFARGDWRTLPYVYSLKPGDEGWYRLNAR